MAERIEALEGAERDLEVMRRRALKVARIVYEADRPNLHWQMMGLVDQIEGVTARLNDLQDAAQMRHEAEDLDLHRERRVELREVKADAAAEARQRGIAER